MRFRWLNNEGMVEYRGKRWPEHKGKRGQILALPSSTRRGTLTTIWLPVPGNVLVQLDDGTVLSTPAGTLRMVKEER